MSNTLITASTRPFLTASSSSEYICATCRRHQSTFRRTRKALKIKPNEAFLPSKTAATDHIIFNPPSSAPDVYHTPTKFLPADDPRRKISLLSIAQKYGTSSGSAAAVKQPSPDTLALVRKEREKTYHLTREDVVEMQRLRNEDPRKWSKPKLAAKFNCSVFFVTLCCKNEQITKERNAEMQAIKDTWSRRKAEAREDRKLRRATWGRDA